ncbi:MAG: acetoin utilization protein AcuC [Pseudomonadota bacterium]
MNETDKFAPRSLPTRDALFIGAARYRRPSYTSNHPLAIPRVSLALDLINAYGAITPAEYLTGRKASNKELTWFHEPAYIQAFQRAQFRGKVTQADRERFQLGNLENPYFPDFFDTPSLATGSSIQGAEQVLAGRTAFSPAGGMHHAAPHQARGFCYLNDPALAIMRLRRAGLRVLYLDIDAHHGDGVEAAFVDDPETLTASIHMDTSYAYPFQGGGIDDQPGGAVNLPLPPGINDAEYRLAFHSLWSRLLEGFRPDVVVLQAGTDILTHDPLSKFRVSNGVFWEAAARVIDESPRLLVLGGGGYHPIALARCWTGVWARLTGRALDERLPDAASALLRAVNWELDDEDAEETERLYTHLSDLPNDGPVREEVRARVQRLLDSHPLLAPRVMAVRQIESKD